MTGRLRPGAPRRRAGVRAAPLILGWAFAFALGCVGPDLTRRHRESRQSWQQSGAESRQSGPQSGESRGAAGAAGLFAGASRLERPALLRAVLRRNPSVQSARWAWRAALERFPQETSLDDPLLGYGVAPASFGSRAVDGAHKVDLSQRLPFPGKLSLRGEIALAEAEVAEHDLEAVRQRLATMASLLFDELYVLDRALEINAEHQQLLEELLGIATAHYEAGRAAQQDPLQAEVERAHLLHREVELETSRRVARGRLNVLLRRRPDRPLPPPPSSLALPAAPDLDREALVREALHTRPELRSLEASLEGRESAVALARREFFPDLTLVGSYNGIMQERDLQPFVGVQVQVPLRIDRRRAALEEARAHLAGAESERRALEDEVRFAVESGADRLEEARHVLRLYESRLLPAARDQVESARVGFEAGRNSFLALIEAERNLRTTRLGYEETVANVSRRTAGLERAVGRIPGLREGLAP